MDTETPSLQEQLSNLFGSYKAEWLQDDIFDLFTEPSYFPELKTARPCVLIGGRGTGKTTVLRGLSYQGQYALSGSDPSKVAHLPFYGMYYRSNTNIVTAFKGPELPSDSWVKYFGHYFNLLLCDLVMKFLEWYQLTTANPIELSMAGYERLAAVFSIEPPGNLKAFSDELTLLRLKFEAFINNVADKEAPPITMQSAPINTLIDLLSEAELFKDKKFFFLIDEYENFEEYQQQIINTMIKHSGEKYTFKLAIKELGFRSRTTLNEEEQLISPADYFRFTIAEKLADDTFRDFAAKVCNARIARLRAPGMDIIRNVADFLPNLSPDEEAELLGVGEALSKALERLDKRDLSPEQLQMEPLRLYFLCRWAESQEQSLDEVLQAYRKQPREWAERYDNYKYAILFDIRKGKRGLRKYYCGWDTFPLLAASNIRYLLELVEQSLLSHLREDNSLDTAVSPKTQTQAARDVGYKNLSELEGISVSGAQLTKLLLSLGRVFQVMAADPVGHTPEVTQFHLSATESRLSEQESVSQRVSELLHSSIMHMALQRFSGTKAATEKDTKEYDYAIHPIYRPLFEFSYRQKRKIMLAPELLLGLIETPRRTIQETLKRQNRPEESLAEPLPEQLEIF